MVRGAAKLKRESSRRRTMPASVRFIRAFYATAQPPHATLRKLPATPRAMLSVQGAFDYARIPLRGIHTPLRMTVMNELQALSGVKVCGRGAHEPGTISVALSPRNVTVTGLPPFGYCKVRDP